MNDIMAWIMFVGIAVIFKCAILVEASHQTINVEPNLDKNVLAEDSNTDITPAFTTDTTYQRLGHELLEILLHPDHGIPLLYIEGYPALDDTEENIYYNQFPELQKQVEPQMSEVPYKRSRYYRKYPWKRQNSREVYDAENRYLCQPSREDVFRLLVALHEARQGNTRTVNFCNRRRAATAVFTNIRFLGRRK